MAEINDNTPQLEALLTDKTRLPKLIRHRLPSHAEHWDILATHSGHKNNIDAHYFSSKLTHASQHQNWKWPKRPVFFITDPHADAEGFVASLIACGGVYKTGKAFNDFALTKMGRTATFVIGGDCLDKGPSNLQLLRALRTLMDLGARVKLLAGNHDMRLFMGIHAMGLPRHPTTEHLFVRMGDKVIPLLKEVYENYLKGTKFDSGLPDEAVCKKRLFPDEDWFERFPEVASGLMTAAGVRRELRKMRKKYDNFEHACAKSGFSMRDVYAIALKCRQLFLDPKGEFTWFFREMQLAYRKGSFLFIHAGLDDGISEQINKKGVRFLNRQFRHHIEKDLFQFYYGSLANTMRTKYRHADLPLTDHGVKNIHRKGVHAIVHGHINRLKGQRVVLKQGLIHIESDVTIDRNSRRKEGLTDYGIGVTIIHPKKRVIGVSSDYPFAKVFEPHRYLSRQEGA